MRPVAQSQDDSHTPTRPSDRAPQPDDVALEDVSRLRLALLRVSRRLRQQAPAGITPSQLSALATIDRHGPLSLGELAAIENVQPPSISRIVGALEGEGYVERASADGDRRVALVRTTQKARRELRTIRNKRDAWLAAQLLTLDGHEVATLLGAVPALEALLEDEG